MGGGSRCGNAREALDPISMSAQTFEKLLNPARIG
jgi:hypothetical protein